MDGGLGDGDGGELSGGFDDGSGGGGERIGDCVGRGDSGTGGEAVKLVEGGI